MSLSMEANDEILKFLVNMKLTKEGENGIVLSKDMNIRSLNDCSFSLVGKFLASKPFNQRAARETMRSVWKLSPELRIVDVPERNIPIQVSERIPNPLGPG